MVFLRYEKFGDYLRLYRITSLILGLNIVMYFLLLLDREGILSKAALIIHPAHTGELWRLVTSMFLHGGFDHLLFNCFALFVFSPPLERLLGSVKYIMFYLGCGIIGNIASIMFLKPLSISVGASGAIYGIFGAYIFMVLFRKHLLDYQSRKTITVILVVGVIYSLIHPVVNLYAHFGGFIGGMILFSTLYHR